MNSEDKLLVAQLEDKIEYVRDRYSIAAGSFLDTHQRKVAEDCLRAGGVYCGFDAGSDVRCIFYGGYQDAERCVPVLIPDYVESDEEIKELLKVVRVSVPKGGRELSHRDYLGSLLALGLDRSVTGDILVRKGEDAGADIIVLASMADFIETNYDKAGRQNLEVCVLPIDQLYVTKSDAKTKTDTVAAMRLDCIAASAFSLSRAKAADAVRSGLISVNNVEVLKPDFEIAEKDKIVFRRKGKAVLAEVGGTSRKGRFFVRFDLWGVK